MCTIRNLKTDITGLFSEGVFDSQSLYKGEMKVSIFSFAGATDEDAEKCIIHYNSLKDNKDTFDNIENRLKKFFLYMYDEWQEMGDMYQGIVDSLKPVMDSYESGEKLSFYLSDPTLIVYAQNEGEIGYGIECGCPWEPEHKCLILIRNDDVVYVGSSGGQEPWAAKENLRCIWDVE